jgi:hypothetical protein
LSAANNIDMTEHFYHYPDDTIFHGIEGNPKGFSFADCRLLTDDNQKIEKLKKRLDTYYINGLTDLNHPFTIAILTCVGIEVLGQVMLGFDNKGQTIESKTIQVYEMLDPKVAGQLSPTFKTSYNNNRNIPGQNIIFTDTFTSYAHIIRKGLRNSFTHTYRSLGVVLSDSLQEMMLVDENKGHIIINPYIFRQKYVDLYNKCFNNSLSNTVATYRQNALLYLDLLLR